MAKKKQEDVGAQYELTEAEKAGIERVHENYANAINTVVDSDQYAREFLVAIKSSQDQEITQISRTETKRYDMIWIDNFENAIGALENIAKDPKKHIRLERYITPIELAKKISSESVIHLSSHSQYVKDIDKNGNVIPNKILTVSAEDEYAIYENRFIKTLVDRALNFINKRYDYITKHADTRDSDVVVIKNVVTIGDVKYEYESKIKISVPSADEGMKEKNEHIFKKIELIRRRLMFMAQGWFMEQLKDCKPVNSPIMQTNIIVKNPNYKKCHILWKFLERYDKLGISIHVKEVNAKFDQAYVDELQKNMFGSIISLQTNKTRVIDLAKVKAYRIQPKIGNKVIDKDFLDSKFDIDGHYYGSSVITPKMQALRKKQEAAKKAKLRAIELKKAEREKARIIAKSKEEERIKKLREEQAEAAERARIAAEKAEAKRREEERIAQEKAREKAILDAEHEALLRAREASRRLAEEDRIKELRILRPSGLTVEEEQQLAIFEEAKLAMEEMEKARIKRMEEIKGREESRKQQLEDKIKARKAAQEARLQHHRDMLVKEQEAKKNKLRDVLMAQAQARLAALRAAEEALRRTQQAEEEAFEAEEDEDFTFSDAYDENTNEESSIEEENKVNEQPSLNEEVNLNTKGESSSSEAQSDDSYYYEEDEDYEDDDDFEYATIDELNESVNEENETIEESFDEQETFSSEDHFEEQNIVDSNEQSSLENTEEFVSKSYDDINEKLQEDAQDIKEENDETIVPDEVINPMDDVIEDNNFESTFDDESKDDDVEPIDDNFA